MTTVDCDWLNFTVCFTVTVTKRARARACVCVRCVCVCGACVCVRGSPYTYLIGLRKGMSQLILLKFSENHVVAFSVVIKWAMQCTRVLSNIYIHAEVSLILPAAGIQRTNLGC